MNQITASMLLHLMEFVTSKEFMTKAVEAVTEAMDMTKTGAEKRDWVVGQLRHSVTVLGPAVATYLVNLAVEAALAYVQAHKA